MYEDKEAELAWRRREYAKKIEATEPELAKLLREKAWKELREEVEKGGVTNIGGSG
jgi:hypothetical protein